MPMYDFKCRTCSFVFDDLVPSTMVVNECPRCKGVGDRKFPAPKTLIKGKYKEKAKEKNDPFGGVPMGEVPGDSDYEWMKQGEKSFGPTP